jgi:hypothetical protein
MAAGVPVVASRTGGIPEAVTEGVEGRLVPPVGAGALAGAVDEPLLEYRLGGASLTARRGETLRHRVRVLEQAAASLQLEPDERAVLSVSTRRHRARMVEQRALEAYEDASPAVRGALSSVMLEPGVRPSTRIAAALALAWPRGLRRVVESRLVGSTGRPSR